MLTTLPDLQSSPEKTHVIPEPPTDPQPQAQAQAESQTGTAPQPLTLTDRLPEHLKVSGRVVGYVLLLSLVFSALCRQPLSHTDVFGHLDYGKLIDQTHAIPRTEPFLPLSEGMPVVDTAWLSQWISFKAYTLWGYPALQFLHAACITLALTLFVRRVHEWTGHAGLTWMGLGQIYLIGWEPMSVARPQAAGTACFAMLLFLLTSRRWHWTHWISIPLVFGFWANLHGSFVVGLLVLGCLGVGRAWDVWRRGGIRQLFRDAVVRRLFLVSQLAVVATLVNPYGIRLYGEALTLSANPNLEELIEWQPLYIRSFAGLATAAAVIALAMVYRRSPRRLPSGEVLMLVGLGLAGLWTSRMLVWWAPIAAGCFVWNLHASRRASASKEAQEPVRGSSRWSMVAVVIPWLFFAITPFAMAVLHKKQPTLKNTLSAATPLGAVAYLNEHPPQGQVFNTYEWGDYLHWAGPEGMQLFVNSHAHLIPTDIWRHYNQVIRVQSDWQGILDKYGVTTLVLDREERKVLLARLKDSQDWEKVFEDDLSAIYIRKKPAA